MKSVGYKTENQWVKKFLISMYPNIFCGQIYNMANTQNETVDAKAQIKLRNVKEFY